MTPSAYAETSSTGGDASYYEEVFTLDEATGEITKTSVTRVDVPQESSASSNAAAQEPSRYSGSSTNAGGSTNTSGVSAGASDSSFVTSTGNGKKIHLTFRALDQVNTVEACAGTVQIKSLDNTVIDGKSYGSSPTARLSPREPPLTLMRTRRSRLAGTSSPLTAPQMASTPVRAVSSPRSSI